MPYIDRYDEAVALCGGHPSSPEHRMIVRSNADHDAETTDPWRANQAALARLSGRPCPLCRRLLGELSHVHHVGTLLLCPEGHGWSNGGAARQEIDGPPLQEREAAT